MSIRGTDKPASRKTNCRVCWEPIHPQAIKCTRCGSYQDWTRHLVRWSALFVSALALAPLWSISQSLTQLAIAERKMARIEAALTACDVREVRVVYENSGELSGIVTDVRFALLLGGVRTDPDLKIIRSDGSGDIVISPGDGPIRAVYRAYIDNTEANFLPADSRPASCAYLLEFNWMDFSGSRQQLRRECACP
jgi:hypothetical protein